jgi:hypothetical protein
MSRNKNARGVITRMIVNKHVHRLVATASIFLAKEMKPQRDAKVNYFSLLPYVRIETTLSRLVKTRGSNCTRERTEIWETVW